jgi:hypothetical protein
MKRHADATERHLARCYQFERDRLAARLAPDGYYALAPHWRGHAVWARLARFCREGGIDPLRYVRWCLALGRVYPGAPPEPNQLLGREALRAYREYLPKVHAELEVQFKIELSSASCRIGVGQALGDDYEKACLMTLGGGDIRVSPLFRYWLARTMGTERALRIGRNYEEDALYQFSMHPAEYGEVYGAGGVLPRDFADRAAKFYAGLIRTFDEESAGGTL